jgi:hypothetical protein
MDRIQEKLSEQPSNEIDSLEAAKKVSIGFCLKPLENRPSSWKPLGQ